MLNCRLHKLDSLYVLFLTHTKNTRIQSINFIQNSVLQTNTFKHKSIWPWSLKVEINLH